MEKKHSKAFEKTLATYIIGFVLSVVLTLGAYYLVTQQVPLTSWSIAIIIAVLALAQFIVQLFFFLHLRLRAKPRWRLVVFSFMLLVVLILVGGSVWIMQSLNNRMVMSSDQVDQYMQDQAGI